MYGYMNVITMYT